MLGWFKKKFDKNGPDTAVQESSEKVSENEKKSFFSRLSHRLAKTRSTFNSQLDTLFLGKKEINPDLFDDLEEILITADLGVATTHELLEYTLE